MLNAVRKNGRMVSAETEASSSTKAEKSIAVMLPPLTGAQWNYPTAAHPATSRARTVEPPRVCDQQNRCVRHGAPTSDVHRSRTTVGPVWRLEMPQRLISFGQL